MTAAVQSACARCGTFAALQPIAGQTLCKPCIDRLSTETPLYSGRAIAALAILTNPTAGIVMLAMNYSRLGDRAKARSWTIAAVVFCVIYVVLMQIDLPNGVYLGANVGLGITLRRTWDADGKQLEALGFKRRNPWWVVLVTLAAIAAYAVIYVAFLMTTGEVQLEP